MKRMPIYTGAADLRPMQGIGTMQSSLGEELGAVAGESLADAPFWGHQRTLDELAAARGDLGPSALAVIGQDPSGQAWDAFSAQADAARAAPDVPIEEAQARVQASGLQVTLPDQPTIKRQALEVMINHAQDERERQVTIARGAKGFIHGALDVGTSMFVGALDPLGAVAFAIPVVGTLRRGLLAGEGGR
jgi:hypothetical protein